MFLPTTTLANLAIRSFGLYFNGPSNSTMYPTGTASGTALSTGMPSSSKLTISVNGECSGSQTCLGSIFGQSCSIYGYCGNGTAYSGEGCQPAFGICDTKSSSIVAGNFASVLSTAAPSTFSTVVLTTSTSVTSSTTITSSSSSQTTVSYSKTPTSTATSAPSSTATSSASPSGLSTAVKYKTFLGDGEASAGWPAQSAWLSFDTLWETKQNTLADSCSQWNVPNNSDEENANLKAAIKSIAKASGVDERFVLAIVMQESNGCVRAPTTKYSVSNPGLLQPYNGKHTCNPGTATSPQPTTPCPDSEIVGMLQDGVEGTEAGSTSLVQALKQSGKTDVAKYYWAARIYNSGSVTDNSLQAGVATHCYASDVANRLVGWANSPTTCTLNSS